jgi:hypothetical protein
LLYDDLVYYDIVPDEETKEMRVALNQENRLSGGELLYCDDK